MAKIEKCEHEVVGAWGKALLRQGLDYGKVFLRP
jgi:hypothetical protein